MLSEWWRMEESIRMVGKGIKIEVEEIGVRKWINERGG